MGFDNVREDIVQSTKEDSKKLLDEAKAEVTRIKSQSKKRIQAYEKKVASETDKAIERYKTRTLAAAASEKKRLVLLKEKALLDDAFFLAEESLKKLPAKKRQEHIRILTKQAEKELGKGNVKCNKDDLKFVPKGTEAPMLGGVIVENSEGTERVDLRYETLLETVQQKSLGTIRTALFK